jgi:hypothetical protein
MFLNKAKPFVSANTIATANALTPFIRVNPPPSFCYLIIFIEMSCNSGFHVLDLTLTIPGWKMDKFEFNNQEHKYLSNFALRENSYNDTYNNLSFSLTLHPLDNISVGNFLLRPNLLTLLFVLTLILFIT